MRHLKYITVLILAGLMFAQCTSDEDLDNNIEAERTEPLPQRNTVLPQNVESLKILAIGNSYTDDAVNYLDDMLESAGMDKERICIYVASIASCSLQQWWNVFETSKQVFLRRAAGNIFMRESGTLSHLMAQDWDIIVFQQYSRLSDKFSTFNPYLNRLAHSAISKCTNPDVCIAWQLTWNYWIGYSSYLTTAERFFDIVSAARQMSAANGIKVIIPTGTAMENARYSTLRTAHGLTRDGVHLSFGTGCYVAGCTWFQKLIAPAFGIDITDTKFTWEVTASEMNHAIYECEDVTDENYTICQRCATDAIAKPYEITPTLK